MSASRTFGALVALSLIACGDAPTSAPVPAAGSAAPSASATASVAAPSSAPALEAPRPPPPPFPAGDPRIAAELEKLGACEGDDCPAREAWEKFVEAESAPAQDDEAKRAEVARRLGGACLGLADHPKPRVREASLQCARDHANGVSDPQATARAMLPRIQRETDADARLAALLFLRELRPTERGLAPEVVAFARPLVGKPSLATELSWLVEAVVPPRGVDAAPEAFAFARELFEAGSLGTAVVDVLVRRPPSASEACAVFVARAERPRRGWAEGLRGIAQIEGHCAAERPRAVGALLRAIEQGVGPSFAASVVGDEARSVSEFLEHAGLSADEKKRVAEALRKARDAVHGATAKGRYDALLEKVK